MISSIISRLVILLLGTLYPAYASYKAVKNEDAEEYVKWMMYWIVFAIFTCAETLTDVFFSWLPFYYGMKIILVIWLLSPVTQGSSILYRKFVHPALTSREQEIDEYITKAKERGSKHFLELGSKGVTTLVQTAIKTLNPILSYSDPSTKKDEVDVDKARATEELNEFYSDDNDDYVEINTNEVHNTKSGKTSKSKGTLRKARKNEENRDFSLSFLYF